MVKKAVIPAAGHGTRFLPATKAQPKEMLPLIDTPTIQYVVQEAIDSGIDDILIITGKGKRAIEDHFDRNFELEKRLLEKNENDLYNDIRHLSDMANIHFIRQKELNGLGDAIMYARQHTGDQPFAVLLGDTVIKSVMPVTQQLIDSYEQYKRPVIGCEQVPKNKVDRYGIIAGERISDELWNVTDLIEKPSIEESPSTLAVAGRYILTPDIYDVLDKTKEGKGNEIQLTDALRALLKTQKIVAHHVEGKRYDIGNKLEYLKTTVEFALQRDEFKKDFLAYLKELVKNS
jgi:UTP--glucose-1-phosphate uridylyltransferase